MPLLRVLLLAIASSAVMFAALSGSASANNLSVNDGTISITWRTLIFDLSGTNITCPVRLEGSFTRSSLTKTTGASAIAITSASLGGACTGGTTTILTASLPWDFQYNSFTGELPQLESVLFDMVGIRISIDPTGVLPACEFGTNGGEALLAALELDETGEVVSFVAIEGSIVQLGGDYLCEIAGDLSYAGNATVGGTGGDPIVVTLI